MKSNSRSRAARYIFGHALSGNSQRVTMKSGSELICNGGGTYPCSGGHASSRSFGRMLSEATKSAHR